MDARPARGRSGGWRRGTLAAGIVVGSIGVVVVGARVTIDRWMRATAYDVCERSSLDLVRAAGAGDVATVRDELDDERDPNERDGSGNTALGCAIPRGRTEVVDALLVGGADPNVSSGAGTSEDLPIELALDRHDIDVLDALLTKGGDPDRSSPDQTPVLVRAIEADDDPTVDLLLAHGADPEHQGDDVPLDIAASAGTDRSVAALLAAGADPNGEIGGRPLVAAAAADRRAAFVALLVAGADLSLPATSLAPTSVGNRVLAEAAGDGNIDAVTALLAAGIDPNEDPHDGPLLRAAAFGHRDVVRLLLDSGADPDAGQSTELVAGFTLLGVNPALADQLRVAVDGTIAVPPAASGPTATDALAAEPPIQIPPLAAAIAAGDDETVALLLEHGADPNRTAWDRYAPLDLAGLTCDTAVTRQLLDAGAAAALAAPQPGGAGPCEDVRVLVGG